MSHFSVLVIGKDMEDVERLLAPYQENNMGDCPSKYLEFRDTEDEYRNEYENETIEMIRSWNGDLVHTWGVKATQHAGCAKVRVPHRERYATFDQFCADWHGAYRDPDKNRYGYWENPHAKWDWYVVGGRWDRDIHLKDGSTANVAAVKDVDLEADLDAWAVITPDGEWHEKGKMGWWGLSDATAESKARFKGFLAEIVKNAAPDFIMAVVDCHI